MDIEKLKLEAQSKALHIADVSGSALFNADCMDILPLIPDNSVDYSFTSPPYNRKRNDKYKNFTDINENWLQLNIDVLNQRIKVLEDNCTLKDLIL